MVDNAIAFNGLESNVSVIALELRALFRRMRPDAERAFVTEERERRLRELRVALRLELAAEDA